jgi:CRISPR-associated protein Cas2
MSRLWLICYDISDDGKRNCIHDILKNYGKRVQYSVFECFLTNRQLCVLRAELLSVIDNLDNLRWYPLCVWCKEKVKFQGAGNAPEDDRFYIE